MNGIDDLIPPDKAVTLYGLLQIRAQHSPQAIAYRQFHPKTKQWLAFTWAEMSLEVKRWQAALHAEQLARGDRVAIMLRNCREWVLFDQAALSLGLVTVPLYMQDRADNVIYILKNCGAKLLFLEGQEHWWPLSERCQELTELIRIVSLHPIYHVQDERVLNLEAWLNRGQPTESLSDIAPGTLASIVYTSGIVGRPKGVMLSHANMLQNAWAALQRVSINQKDTFLSCLPLSHSLERTVGYYLPIMSGACVAYARSPADLAEDMLTLSPTVLIAVPRIYERAYSYIQIHLKHHSPLSQGLFNLSINIGWRLFEARQGRRQRHWQVLQWVWPLVKFYITEPVIMQLGGQLRIAVSGGAPLNPEVARFFLSLGVPMLHGYGLTECSPIVSVNTLEDNLPTSVGKPLPGLEVRLGEHNELLVYGHSVMQGYWADAHTTHQTIDAKGWLHTGDQARIDKGYIFITGRLKEIIVLANGEKMPPVDMEMAIATDPLFEQVMVIGEGKPYLVCLVVLHEETWRTTARQHGFEENSRDVGGDIQVERFLLQHIEALLHDFPGYAQVRRLSVLSESWTVENNLLTPTLKLRRKRIIEYFKSDIERLYSNV